MKHIIITSVAAISAAFAFAEGYQDWYTPAVDFSQDTAQFNFWVGDTQCKMPELALNSKLVTVEAAVELAVANADLSDNAKNAFRLAKTALAQSMYTKLRSEMNRKKIDSLGASIETIFQLTNAEKIDASGNIISAGKLQDGVRDTLLNKKNSLIGATTPASGGGSGSTGGEDKPLQITITKAPFNTNQFASRKENGEAKQILKGSDTLAEISGSSFPFSSGLYLATGWLPMLSDKDGTLTWKAWNGVDTGIIDVSSGTGGSDGKLQLKDWYGGTGGCELNVKGLLTNKTDPDYADARNTHYFLTRCKDGTEYKLHYMSVGGLIDSLTPVEPDEVSIETHINDDGTTNLCVYAVNEANEEVAESDTELGFIPYVDGGDTLAWAGFSEFFNPNVFTTDDNGQIILNGVEDAEADDIMMVTANGSGTEQEIKVKKMDGAVFEADSEKPLTIRGFGDTHTDYLWEGGDADASLIDIPVQVAGDSQMELQWRVFGGVDGNILHAGEDTEHMLSLAGFRTTDHDCDDSLNAMLTDKADSENRNKHAFLARYGTGADAQAHWVKITDVLPSAAAPDDSSITTNTANGAVENGYLSIYGVADANDEAGESETELGFIPYVDGGETLAWAGFSEFFNENVFTTDENGKIVLNGIEEAGEDDVMLVTAKGTSSEQEVKVKKLDGNAFDAGEGTDLTLRGMNDTSTDYLLEDGDIAGLSEIPVKVAGENGYQLEWRVWGGLDGGIFEANEDTDHLLSILGWNNHDHDCDTTLSAMMTDDDGDNRSKHYILTKYDNENVHWVPMGDKIGEKFKIDCVSVTTNSEDGAVTDGELSLYGFASADEEAGESETDIGFIPYVDGGGTLAWAGLSEFFSDKVFDTTSDGRIILNGVSEEGSDKVRVLAVNGAGDEQTVSTVAFDNASVDGSIETAQIIQMHAFDTAPSPYGGYSTLTFADALTNASANINGMSIPVRYPNGNKVEIGYIPMGKVTGIPSASVDNLTIEATKDDDAGDNDPEKLRIVGAKEATKGQLLKMGDNGKVEWGDFQIEVDRPEGLEEDEYPLYITAADPEQDEPAKIGINGWETTDSPEGLYGAGNGKPVTYRFADIKSLEADGDLRTVELKGYGDAGNYSMAFKDSENGLGWIAPPSSGSALLTMNHGAEPTATVLGNSVETETLNNKVTLNIKGFTNGGGCDTTMSSMMTEDSQASNREHHQVLTRYSTGSGTPALHWVPMGDKVSGGGADVDGVSITTNTANGAVTSGLASIYGFSTASAGDVPHKKADGKIEWKPVAAGGALKFKGTTSTTVTSTNRVEFASTDTTYTASDEGNGNVKVTSQLSGISGASTGKCPFKGSGNTLSWEYPIKVNGYGPVRNINFQSGNDSDVRITTTVSGDTATVKIDVYWK